MKKNLLSMALATVVAASLVGCGSTASETQTSVSENAEAVSADKAVSETQTSSEPKILKTAASFALEPEFLP